METLQRKSGRKRLGIINQMHVMHRSVCLRTIEPTFEPYKRQHVCSNVSLHCSIPVRMSTHVWSFVTFKQSAVVAGEISVYMEVAAHVLESYSPVHAPRNAMRGSQLVSVQLTQIVVTMGARGVDGQCESVPHASH